MVPNCLVRNIILLADDKEKVDIMTCLELNQLTSSCEYMVRILCTFFICGLLNSSNLFDDQGTSARVKLANG